MPNRNCLGLRINELYVLQNSKSFEWYVIKATFIYLSCKEMHIWLFYVYIYYPLDTTNLLTVDIFVHGRLGK